MACLPYHVVNGLHPHYSRQCNWVALPARGTPPVKAIHQIMWKFIKISIFAKNRNF